MIYTGNFSINWSYFKGIQPWQIYNLFNIQKYCENHNLKLRVIDNSNKKMSSIFNAYRYLSNNKADAWSIATLSSIVAMYDFLESKEDNFCWIDLDIAIVDLKTNIFDLMAKDTLTLDMASVEQDSYYFQRKKEFVTEFMKLNLRFACNTGILLADRSTVSKIVSALNKYCNIFDRSFQGNVIEFYKEKNYFMSDECIIESYLNLQTDISIKSYSDKIRIQTVTPTDQNIDYNLDIFGYHFASQTKFYIPEFWQKRGRYVIS